MPEKILAIDCGTQSLRALIFDPEGNLLAGEQERYQPYFSTRPGWAEQDPEVFWEALKKTCQNLVQKFPGYVRDCAGVVITTQRNTLINVDEKGQPLRYAITWLDQRKAKNETNFPPAYKALLKAVGMEEAVTIMEREGKVNWIRQNQPEIWENTHRLLMVSGFLHYRLTGNFADSVASQIGHLPFDFRKRTWASPRDIKSRIYPVDKDKLPSLLEPTEIVGEVTKKASEETGLPAGLTVVAAASDKGCETLGAGCLHPHEAALSFGTTATVQTVSPRYCEPIRFLPAYPAPLPDCYNPEVQIFRGYWMIRWFREEFGQREKETALKMGISPEELLNRLLKEVPPGSLGLILQPFWSPCLKTPEAKGAMIGFGDAHNRAHIYRAIIEGIGYALRDGLEKIERATGKNTTRLYVTGGGSQSDDICQITAHLFNLPVHRPRIREASGLGAAIVGAVGLNIHQNFSRALDRMVHTEKTFHPGKKEARIYSRLYQEVYQNLYKNLQPTYKRIREITGYPEKFTD